MQSVSGNFIYKQILGYWMMIHDQDTGGNLCQMQYGKFEGMKVASLEHKTSGKAQRKPLPWWHQ